MTSDTHVNPAAEILDKYVDPEFRPRLPELAPYRARVGQAVDGPSELHNYRVGAKFYRRILGEAAPRDSFSGRDSKWMGSRKPRPGIQDDQARQPRADMDDEGTDVHFLIPTSWLSLVGLDDASIEVAMIRAYHRHMADFCGQFPERLKSPIVASRAPAGRSGARNSPMGQIRNGPSRSCPCSPRACRPITPSLLTRSGRKRRNSTCRSRTTASPGPRPIIPATAICGTTSSSAGWRRIPWGAMRFVAAFIGGGIVRPLSAAAHGRAGRRLRLAAVLGASAWTSRRSMSAAPRHLKMTPSEYMKSGRFFCSIEHHEGEDMFQDVTRFLGDDVLMYASDYPHSECQFPDSVSNILAWPSLGAERQRKLLSGNADRFFRRT